MSDPHRLRHLLVTGSPQQHVFEVGMLLNEHPQVLLGIERFSALNRTVDPFLLAPERLIAPLSVETMVRGELLYARLRERIGSGKLALTGDVDAAYVRALPRIGPRLGVWRAAVVVVIGEASASPPDDWRRAVSGARETQRHWFGGRVFVLPYSAFSAGSEPWLDALLAFTELPHTDRIDDLHATLRSRPEVAGEDFAAHVDDSELLEWLRTRAGEELARYGRGRPAAPRLPDVPLNENELASPEREREELQVQRRRGSEWPDEHDALRARYIELTRATVGRDARVAKLALTAATGLPAKQLRINLVAPEERLHELGRLDAVHRLATNLGRLCTVRLVSTRPPLRRPLDVELLVANTLTPEILGDCDAVIYPAELADAGALLGATRAILWLDGFTAPDDRQVLANLGSAQLVLAASRWLGELAGRQGAPAIHFPLGLDRLLFAPGPPNDERGLRVTGIAQAADHFGCTELSEAMVRVREMRPEVEVTLIGGVPADGATEFLAHPTLGVLAQTLRSSAVHVTSAREDGFNFTGAAALASGASLVSTDTRGSRDYAVHDRTALVSAVGDSQALADNVLALLAQPSRRARLAWEGSHHVRSMMRPWSEIARALALILTERD